MNATDNFVSEYKAADVVKAPPPSLLAACCDMVSQLKADGHAPEQMVVYIKNVIRSAGRATPSPSSFDAKMISHCIVVYYEI